MITGHGIDLIEISRVRASLERFGPRFVNRLFDPREIACAARFADPAQYYASRFAAKEAFAKSMGTGFTGFGPKDVIILRGSGQPPRFDFSQKLQTLFPTLKPEDFLLSISHSRDMAAASVIRRS
ncbi:MAG: holo-ACP synthase [Nitrospinae bacterium]|nr:holo-ACP synthase [Nitrospinota bacterium]